AGSSVNTGGRADDQFADIHIGWLVDSVGNGAGNSVGGDGDAAVIAHGLTGTVIGNALCQLRFGDPGGEQRHADVATDLLAQPFGNSAHRVLGGAVDRCGRAHRVGADGGDVDELARMLALHQRQPGSNAVQYATNIDVDHPV